MISSVLQDILSREYDSLHTGKGSTNPDLSGYTAKEIDECVNRVVYSVWMSAGDTRYNSDGWRETTSILKKSLASARPDLFSLWF